MTFNDFEHIVHQVRPIILKTAYQFFQNKDDAEDVVQEVLMRLWLKYGKLDYDEAEKLAIVATKNLCVSTIRHQRQRAHIPITDNLDIVSLEPPDAQLKAEEYAALLEKAIQTLTRSEQRLIYLMQQDGLDTNEIAIITGIHVRSVRTMVSAARKKLLKQLAQWNNH